ncbi:MAG TPA: TonB-dependent receptor plug domain-containing protein [Longimicrobium sp.]|jgi:hypothetical protein
MTTTRTWLSGLLLLAGVTVCGTGAAAQSTAPAAPASPAQTTDTSARGAAPAADAAQGRRSEDTRPKRSRRFSTRLEEAEIAELAVAHTDAYSLLASVRPNWLRTRGVGSMTRPEQVQVYRDGIRAGGPASLRQIPSNSILSIEYLDGNQATARFGTDHGNGAILVRSK